MMIYKGSQIPFSHRDLPIVRVNIKEVFLPSGHLQLKAFSFFNELNFVFSSDEAIEINSIVDSPILLLESRRHKYELIGGFRTFNIARQKNVDIVNAFVINGIQMLDLQKICIGYLLEPLMFWAFETKKFEVTLKRFLKETSTEYPELKEYISTYYNAVKKVSRYKGRLPKKPQSKILEILAK